jgi:hypothetical protein
VENESGGLTIGAGVVSVAAADRPGVVVAVNAINAKKAPAPAMVRRSDVCMKFDPFQ